MAPTILSVTNNADSSYTFLFSKPVTSDGNDPTFLEIWAGGSGWLAVSYAGQLLPAVIQFNDSAGRDNCTLWRLSGADPTLTPQPAWPETGNIT